MKATGNRAEGIWKYFLSDKTWAPSQLYTHLNSRSVLLLVLRTVTVGCRVEYTWWTCNQLDSVK